jgi:hypothetical protein
VQNLRLLGAETRVLRAALERRVLTVELGQPVLAAPGPLLDVRQPEQQARALEPQVLLERQAEPLERRARPKPAQQAHPGAAEQWRVCRLPREKLPVPQVAQRCRAQMQLSGRELPWVLLVLPAQPERWQALPAAQDALWRRQLSQPYPPLPLLPERPSRGNVCGRVRRDRGRESSSGSSFRLRRFRAGSRSGPSP